MRLSSTAEKLAKFIFETDFPDLPAETVQCAKERVLDILSAAIAGACSWDCADRLLSAFASFAESGRMTLVGRRERAGFLESAAVNSCFAHAVELDDGHSHAGMHAGAVVVPAVLSMCEKLDTDGRDAIAAVVLGYDVAYRFARSMSPNLIKKGFHPSAICGTVGAAAAAAKLLKLDAARTADALRIAAIQASGLMEATISGQSSKGIMVGHAASTGIASAYFARAGFPGPEQAFEGKKGFLRAFSEDVQEASVLRDLGTRFEIEDTYVKLYPCCRHAHAPIEGVVRLMGEHGLTPDGIDRIVIGMHPVAYDLTAHEHRPKDAGAARFSTTYCVATAVLTGTFRMTDLEADALADPERAKVEDKVGVELDEEATNALPAIRGAKISIRTKKGDAYSTFLHKLKGSPDLPIGWKEIVDKFEGTALLCFPRDRVADIVSKVGRMDALAHVSELTALLSVDRGQ